MSGLLLIDVIFYGVLGIMLGILISWVYYKNLNKINKIGKIIDTAMIENNVLELEELSIELLNLVNKITESSEDLNRQVYNARDIELNLKSLYDLKKIKNIDNHMEVDIQDLNEEVNHNTKKI